MKWKLLLCGVVLVAAGCARYQNPYAGFGEYSFASDGVPQPMPDLTPAELSRIEQATRSGPALPPPASPSQSVEDLSSSGQ